MSGIVGGGDEAEEKEDEVRHPKDAGELLMNNLLSVRHLLLCVSPESVPPNNFLQQKQKKKSIKSCMKSYKFNSECIHTNACTQMFTADLCTIAQNWKQPNCPSAGQRLNKLWCIHTLESYSVRKRNKLPTNTTQMNSKIIRLSERRQTQIIIAYAIIK